MELVVESTLPFDFVCLFESTSTICSMPSDCSLRSSLKKPKLSGSGDDLENNHADYEAVLQSDDAVLQPGDCMFLCNKPPDLFELRIMVTLSQDVKPSLSGRPKLIDMSAVALITEESVSLVATARDYSFVPNDLADLIDFCPDTDNSIDLNDSNFMPLVEDVDDILFVDEIIPNAFDDCLSL
jgi:hypothetical protein